MGICAEGRLRCHEGCLTCVRVNEPRPELCNDLDDDCNGLVDDGPPEEMGDPPPAFAARLLDFSVPRRLAPGEDALAWALFENVGAAPWAAGQVLFSADSPTEGEASRFYDASTWLAHDVLSVISEEVAPDGVVHVVFQLQAAEELSGDVTETFRLMGPSGRPMYCPSPGITVTIGPRQRVTSAEVDLPSGSQSGSGPSLGPASPEDAWVSGGCGCDASLGRGSLGPLLVLGLLGLLFRRRRRRGL